MAVAAVDLDKTQAVFQPQNQPQVAAFQAKKAQGQNSGGGKGQNSGSGGRRGKDEKNKYQQGQGGPRPGAQGTPPPLLRRVVTATTDMERMLGIVWHPSLAPG